MCGILGWYTLDEGEVYGRREAQGGLSLEEGMKEAESRGRDATGIYSKATGVVKCKGNSTYFSRIHSKEIEIAGNEEVVIAHTRAATMGDENFNENNHPHESKNFVLIHNGHFSNLPKVKGYEYSGECDSELALAFIETFGVEKALSMFTEHDGYALAIIDKTNDKFYLYRNRNPIAGAIDIKTGKLLFASTPDIILKMDCGIGIGGLQIPSATTAFTFNEHTMYAFSDGKLEKREKIMPKKTAFPHCFQSEEKEVTEKLLIDEMKKQKEVASYAPHGHRPIGLLGERATVVSRERESPDSVPYIAIFKGMVEVRTMATKSYYVN